jgi:DNA-binding MarR family transcriptional regulator
MIVQRLKKEVMSDIGLAEKYYLVLSATNDLMLTTREIQLMAYIAVKGSVSISSNRDEFCKKYETTNATVNNIVSKLKKMGLMIKKEGKIVVNPIISLDFTKDLTLDIKILHGKT